MTTLENYIQNISEIISNNRLPHAILVESKNFHDVKCYIDFCAKKILKTSDLVNHPDFWTIFPTGKMGSIKIDSIRSIIELAQKSANVIGQKVFVLFHANKLGKGAANALLKILEEPPLDTTFFLTAESKNFLPPTIVSRCALHHLPCDGKYPMPDEILGWLVEFKQIISSIFLDATPVTIIDLYAMNARLTHAAKALRETPSDDQFSETQSLQQHILCGMAALVMDVLAQKKPAHFTANVLKIIQDTTSLLRLNYGFSQVTEIILLRIFSFRFNA